MAPYSFLGLTKKSPAYIFGQDFLLTLGAT